MPVSHDLIVYAGLNVVHDETRLKRKEEKWVSNFPKYTCLSDGTLDVDGKKGPPPRGRSNSPPRQRTREVVSAADRRSRKKEDAIAAHSKPLRSACYDPNIAPEDVVMLGMYRLDERQQEIYRNFVDMLAEFDEYDRVMAELGAPCSACATRLSSALCADISMQGNILEDALRDAQGEEDLLEGYGGTSLATAPAIASLQGAPAATAAGAAAGASSAGARPGSAPAKARSHSPGAHPLHPPHSATGTQQAAGTHRPGTSDPAFVGRN